MTRVVAKTGQNDLVVTSSQPGVLYVSGLPVEKNIYAGLSRKLKTISDAFSLTYGRNSRITVRQKSSTKLDLMNDSIDYAFIDPPFGGNIPYAEVNFVNEAWLGNLTDVRDEAIVSRHQHKSIEDYQRLLTNSFAELNRVLKPKAGATIVFHSATAEVWNALRGAYKDAGFTVERASVLDKTQSSFKQVTTAGSVKGDPVLLLSKHAALPAAHTLSTWQIAAKLHRQSLASSDPEERSPQRLYSRFVSHFLMRDETVPVDADAFYRWFRLRRDTQPNFDAYA
jgi:hypothetical protein